MIDQVPFSFRAAFDRNIGWVTEAEQQALRGKRVAIAGMGGVGGFHLLTLARLGIGGFSISDLDRFEIANFNRQTGAVIETIDKAKIDVLADMALGINPELRIRKFESGVNAINLDAFLEHADLFVDGLDFFVLDIRRKVFARCAELGIPALTAAPVGMGVGLLVFTPRGMGFEDYFRFEGRTELQQYINFLIGIAPSAIHRKYLVDAGRLDFGRRRAPSTVIGCELCASVTAAAAIKLLLGRGEIKPAPYHHHYDAYLGRLVETRLRWGNAGPIQRLKANRAERAFAELLKRPLETATEPKQQRSVLEEILDIARWAPSGDNAQPWRFRLLDNETVSVSVRDDSYSNIYEYRNAEPTLLSAGMLLESMRIAASAFNRNMNWRYEDQVNSVHRIIAQFPSRGDMEPDPLYSYLSTRSVNRRPYQIRRLSTEAKDVLTAALGDRLTWTAYERFSDRLRLARLNAIATDIRLSIPETFPIHQRMVDWNRDLSPAGIPAGAIGLDPVTLRIMHWAMQHWSRTKLLNRLGGTFTAALQMDYLPGLCSAAFFAIRFSQDVHGIERTPALLDAGARIQRFWLTATKLGLVVQPCLATLAFAHYGKTSIPFTVDRGALRSSKKLADLLEHALGVTSDSTIFIGRIGYPAQVSDCRSTRLSLDQLIES